MEDKDNIIKKEFVGWDRNLREFIRKGWELDLNSLCHISHLGEIRCTLIKKKDNT